MGCTSLPYETTLSMRSASSSNDSSSKFFGGYSLALLRSSSLGAVPLIVSFWLRPSAGLT